MLISRECCILGVSVPSDRPATVRPQTLSIYFDGECPVCTRYVRYYRLGDGNISVSLVDLRDCPERVTEFNAMGFNVDEGMIIVLDKETYHGVEAVHILALLSTPIGFFNRCNRWIFSHRWLAEILYPILVGCRNLLLFLLGREKIQTTGR